MATLMARPRRRPSDGADPADLAAYERLRSDPRTECEHGIAAGRVRRPWCGTPACPQCRRHWMLWRTIERQEALLPRVQGQ